MDVEFQVRPHYVLARATGAWDARRAGGAIAELIGHCNAHNLTRILVDGTRIETQIPIADRYDLATRFAAVGGRLRMALLMSTDNMFSKTFENTATNRGTQVLTTDSLQEALSFLNLPAIDAE